MAVSVLNGREVAGRVKKEVGSIDILVNNAFAHYSFDPRNNGRHPKIV